MSKVNLNPKENLSINEVMEDPKFDFVHHGIIARGILEQISQNQQLKESDFFDFVTENINLIACFPFVVIPDTSEEGHEYMKNKTFTFSFTASYPFIKFILNAFALFMEPEEDGRSVSPETRKNMISMVSKIIQDTSKQDLFSSMILHLFFITKLSTKGDREIAYSPIVQMLKTLANI